MKKHGLLFMLSCSLLALTACGGGSSSTNSSGAGSSGGATSSSEPSTPKAEGVQTYQYADPEVRTEILGKLEKYAVENKLTGLTLYGDGGYVMYNPIVVKGTNNYIPGYGFGVLAEGELNGDLEGETNPAWKRYYHTYETEDPKKINYMDDKGAVVGDLIGYVSAGYFDTEMNETKDGYNWVGDLSPVNRPIPISPNADGFTNKYRVQVKVGSDLKYSTSSTKYASYNNREVALEDYITPYKIYYTQAYGMARGSENLTGSSSLAGTKAYYDGSKAGFDETLWEGVGIKAIEEGGKSYLEFTFNSSCTRFYAMYYLTSAMFAPVPADFITDIGGGNFAQGVKNWGVFSETEDITDHWLCTGPYMFERWDENQQIVFKKNPNYADRGRYKTQGVHVNILTAAKEDEEAGIKEFLINKLHASGIPSKRLDEFRDDPRTTMTGDSSTYKLNLNTCDAATWESLFGVNGSIKQTAREDYWQVEPAMNNKDFVSGLSFALDRQTLANYLGRTPSGTYFASAYMSDPEGGVSYNTTKAHKDAVASVMEGTDGYGYSLEKAKASFKKAADKLIADGVYEEGDTIEIEIAWQQSYQEQREHAQIAKMLTEAFNTDENPLNLEVKFWVGAVWSDVYYNKMMTGQFDIGFGSISGNTLDPLNFLEVLKSDNSSTFTLNWGLDTNANNEANLIEFDGKLWSFDALWTAADQGAYIEEGANSPLFKADSKLDLKRNADGSLSVTGRVKEVIVPGKEEGTYDAIGVFAAICIYGCSDSGYADYDEYYIYADEGEPITFEDISEDGFNLKFTATFPADVVAAFEGCTYVLGFDFYKATSLLGSTLKAGYDSSVEVGPGGIPSIPNA